MSSNPRFHLEKEKYQNLSGIIFPELIHATQMMNPFDFSNTSSTMLWTYIFSATSGEV